MIKMPERYCFISYSSNDQDFVERLATDLIGNNLNIFFDKWEIKVGDSIVEKINLALGKMTELIIVLSKESIKSNWVQKELSSALMKKLKDNSVKILPVLIEKCDIPSIINDIKFADFTEAYENGLIDLTDSLDVTQAIQSKSTSIIKPLDISLKNLEPVKITPKRFSDFPTKSNAQQALVFLIDLALIINEKEVLFCGQCRNLIKIDGKKRPLVCSKCGLAINWIGIKTKIIKTCPICNHVYTDKDNFCSYHYPPVSLLSKEIDM